MQKEYVHLSMFKCYYFKLLWEIERAFFPSNAR